MSSASGTGAGAASISNVLGDDSLSITLSDVNNAVTIPPFIRYVFVDIDPAITQTPGIVISGPPSVGRTIEVKSSSAIPLFVLDEHRTTLAALTTTYTNMSAWSGVGTGNLWSTQPVSLGALIELLSAYQNKTVYAFTMDDAVATTDSITIDGTEYVASGANPAAIMANYASTLNTAGYDVYACSDNNTPIEDAHKVLFVAVEPSIAVESTLDYQSDFSLYLLDSLYQDSAEYNSFNVRVRRTEDYLVDKYVVSFTSVVNGDTFILWGTTFTFVTSGTGAQQVVVGTNGETMANFVAKVSAYFSARIAAGTFSIAQVGSTGVCTMTSLGEGLFIGEDLPNTIVVVPYVGSTANTLWCRYHLLNEQRQVLEDILTDTETIAVTSVQNNNAITVLGNTYTFVTTPAGGKITIADPANNTTDATNLTAAIVANHTAEIAAGLLSVVSALNVVYISRVGKVIATPTGDAAFTCVNTSATDSLWNVIHAHTH